MYYSRLFLADSRRTTRAMLVAVALLIGWARDSFAQDWILSDAPKADWLSVACSADGRKLVACAIWAGVYTSTNGGAAWTRTAAPVTNWYAVASSADGTKLIATTVTG